MRTRGKCNGKGLRHGQRSPTRPVRGCAAASATGATTTEGGVDGGESSSFVATTHVSRGSSFEERREKDEIDVDARFRNARRKAAIARSRFVGDVEVMVAVVDGVGGAVVRPSTTAVVAAESVQ